MDQLDKEQEKVFSFRNSIQLSITPIGLASARFQSGLFFQDKLILPTACSLTVWDVNTQLRIKVVKSNSACISCIQQNEKYIYSISFNGEIVLLDKQTLEVVKRVMQYCGMENRYSSISSKYLSISAEFSELKGCIHIYDLEGNITWRLNGIYRFGTVFDDLLVALYQENEVLDSQLVSAENLEKMKNSQKYFYSIKVFKVGQEEPLHSTELICKESIVIITAAQSPEPYHYTAYISSDRRLFIYSLDQKQCIYKGKFEGAGGILSCSFNGADLILCSNKDRVTRIKCDQTFANVPDYILKSEEYPPTLTYEKRKYGLDAQPQFIREFASGHLLVINEEGVYLSKGEDYLFKRQFGGITFCGVGISNCLKKVFAGDFTGNIHGFSIDNLQLSHDSAACVGLPIRSLAHLSNFPAVIFGTVDGTLYFWDMIEEPVFIDNVGGSLTILRTEEQNDKLLILASTTEGYFYIYERNQGTFKKIVSHLAHRPQQDFDRKKFGSLDIRSEVWSTCFHPRDLNIVATCSEDQNVHIFKHALSDPKIEKILTGHKLAVTSVDWKQMKQGIVLASCSDDQTVRFYDEKLELFHEISTSWIKEWHTLTYMALQEDGDLVAIAAQNGFFFLYSLTLGKFLWAEKIHLGGIEGLVWKGNLICTCSSDNILNVIDMQESKYF